jgi:hypothetical protein
MLKTWLSPNHQGFGSITHCKYMTIYLLYNYNMVCVCVCVCVCVSIFYLSFHLLHTFWGRLEHTFSFQVSSP